MISMGNSLPSFRSPISSIPVPICCASASAARPGSVRDQPFRKTLRNNARHLLAQKFIAAVAKLLLRLGIQQDNLPVLIHHHHSIWSRLQKPPVSGLHLHQMLLA